MSIDWDLITPEVLNSLSLDDFFEAASAHECSSYCEQITGALKNETKWNPVQRNALRFVGATLNMMLQHGNAGDPFGPMFVMDGERSAIPTDYPREKIKSLVDWSLEVRSPEARARFLDVAWVSGKSFPAAQAAVSAYLDAADVLEDPDDWTSFAARLERALRLAASLGKGGTELRETVLQKIESVIHKYKGTDPLFLTHRLTSLLLDHGFGDAATLADYARTAAQRANLRRNYWTAKDYFDLAARCYSKVGEPDAAAESLRDAAEALVSEGELAASQQGGGRGAIAGSSIMAQAFNAMRQAPGGKERSEAIHVRLLELQEASLLELKPVSTTVDIQELVEKAVQKSSGKSFQEALMALCGVGNAPSVDKLMAQVKAEARTAVLSSMFSSDIINSRGRVVAKAPPLAEAEENLEDEGLRFRLFRNARNRRDLVVQAFINPMRTIIFNEHNPDRNDLLSNIRHSPWIPPGHVESIVRVLIAGFQGDMLIVGHMLPPQIEAVIRHVVEIAGGDTSMFNAEGLQPERSLNVLLTLEEAKNAFGVAGILELEDIFVDQLGSNLRNEVAHGLMSDQQMFGSDVLYAWWLLLKYCVRSSQWAAEQASRSIAEEPAAEG